MCNSSEFNPTWLILLVNSAALFFVPFLTYRYAHKNNVKTLKEKWITELRNATSSLVGACSKLYYANDMRYQTISMNQGLTDAERKIYIRRCEEAQAEVEGVKAKIDLLFKPTDASFLKLQPLIADLISSVDKPTNLSGTMFMESTAWLASQRSYMEEMNSVLHEEWNKITK